jgi:3-oxoacyl-[acyl-carrier protein] reductase
MHLDGKVALVTGASRGIGRAAAISLAQRGAKVVVNYAGNLAAAEETAALITQNGGQALIVKADVKNAAEVEDLVKQTLAAYGRIDILVNNAGITRDNLLMRLKEEDWDAVLDTNLKGIYYTTKAVSKIMIKQKSGKIINITSVVGLTGNAGQANYAAAKAGVIGFTKSMAKELASRGITVNAVAPGFIETDMTGGLSEAVKSDMMAKIPLARLGSAEEVAAAIVFFASNEADYITGQTLTVDGGMVM